MVKEVQFRFPGATSTVCVNGSPTSVTLHGFCDVSTCTYAAEVYLVIRTDVGTSVQFVSCISDNVTLGAAFSSLAVQTHCFRFQSLQPTLPQLKLQCYTDSQIALYWIRGTNREWKPFVRNRVNKIRCNVHPSSWNHCLEYQILQTSFHKAPPPWRLL